MKLKDSKIELCTISKVDAKEFFALIEQSRSYLRQWLGWLDITISIADLGKFIDSVSADIAERKALCFLIKSENKIVGIIHLRDIDWTHKKAMIGYWVGEQFRGQGFAKRATQLVVTHAFNELKLHRIEIRCATENLASQAIPKSLGFVREGILRDNEWLYDHFVDHVVFSALSREWKA